MITARIVSAGRNLQASSLILLCSVLAAPGVAFANDVSGTEAQPSPEQAAPSDPLRFPLGDGSIKISLEAGAQVVTESNSFWNISDSRAPTANYNPDMTWGEGYLKAGATIDQTFGSAALELGVSAIGSKTVSADILASRDGERIVLENAYVSLRFGLGNPNNSFTLSGGAQPYKVGNGMLLADGGVDGFERGALIFGPRKAWEQTGIVKVKLGKFLLEGFHLNPRELDSGDTRTIVNGGKVEFVPSQGQTVGLSYNHVPRSEAPYIQAAPNGVGAPTIITNGRDGLSSWQGWFKLSPIAAMPGFSIAGDYAHQRNGRLRLKAWGGRIEVSNTFLKSAWRPTIAYSFQTFSGDDPATPELERFDPMFYDGGQAAWATGTNGSFVFINTNVRAHRLMLNASPSPRDIVTFRYAYVDVNELRSPVQFGQATRPSIDINGPGLVTGVTKRHLSDDILIEYTRVITSNFFVTAGVGHSWPGGGLKSSAAGLKPWTGAFLNAVVSY